MMHIEKILRQYDFIEFALIFGSYASNKYTLLSDIDIAIYTKEQIDIFTQGEIIATLNDKLDKRIDLVVLNDLYKKDSKLSYNILQSHKIIFNDSSEKYNNFKVNSLKYYFDMEYTYNMFNKALSKRLKDGTYGKTKAS